MTYPASTSKIQYYRAKDTGANQDWINWAYEMIQSGFETENLLYLASFSSSEDSWHVREIGNKALIELSILPLAMETAMTRYAGYLVKRAIAGNEDQFTVLGKLSNLYLDNDRPKILSDFDSLYCAKLTLVECRDQWYWTNADRANIDAIISNYFKQWLDTYRASLVPLN